jgi:hypothetical protein
MQGTVSTRRQFAKLLGAAGMSLAAHAIPTGFAMPSTRGAHPVQSLIPAGRLALLAGNALWLVGPDGGRLLASGTGGWLQDPVWSPDGSTLVYAHIQWRAPTAATSVGGVPWPAADIFAVQPDTPDPRPFVVARRESLNESLVSPAWSPDGASLYVVRRRPVAFSSMDVETDVLRIHLASGAREVLDVAPGVGEVTVGPDGSIVCVATLDRGVTGVPETALYRVTTDGSTQLLARASESFGFFSFPRFKSDGTLAFAAGGGALALMAQASRATFIAGPRTVSAHGAQAWLWLLERHQATPRLVPMDGLDDLAGLSWAGDALLIVDAAGPAVIDTASGEVRRLPGSTGTGFAYHEERR